MLAIVAIEQEKSLHVSACERAYTGDFIERPDESDDAVTLHPLTLGRLQAAYSADERRAIYDAVIASRPACDELADLALG
ncbi:jg18117, partial [Pararge aegeria aegeria]